MVKRADTIEKAKAAVGDNAISVIDVCKLFVTSRTTIWIWRKNKSLPAYNIKVGRKTTAYFKLDEVIKWADKNGIEYNDSVLRKLSTPKPAPKKIKKQAVAA